MNGMRVRRVGAIALLAASLAACSNSRVAGKATVDVSVFHLKVGDCIVPPTTIKADVTSLKVVPCDAPHTQEVFALVSDQAGDVYPGDAAITTFANGSCLQQFAPYVGDDYRDSSLFYTYLLPSVRSWAAGDRTVVCIITTTGRPLTKSVKGSRR